MVAGETLAVSALPQTEMIFLNKTHLAQQRDADAAEALVQLGAKQASIPLTSVEGNPLTGEERRAFYTAFTTDLAGPQPSCADFSALLDAWDFQGLRQAFTDVQATATYPKKQPWQQKQTLWLLRAVLENLTSSRVAKITLLLRLARGRAYDVIGYGDSLPGADFRRYYHTSMLCHVLAAFPLFTAALAGKEEGSDGGLISALGFLLLASGGLPTESEKRYGTELEQRLKDRGVDSAVSPWRCVWTE